MALQTKTKIADLGEILGKKGQEFTFIDPPLIDAPNTEVTKNDSPRQLPDPALLLKPLLGIERIRFNSVTPVIDEVGPGGRTVYEGDNKDPRVRFVDAGVSSWANITDTSGSRPNAGIDAFVEIIFFGTGLNLVTFLTASDRDAKASIDGGGFGSNLFASGASPVLATRNYDPNQVISVASGLTLDTHTVKIRIDDADGISVYGFEILNEDTQIQIPQGEMFANGLKYTHPALETLDFNSGFDGAPVLNGRGGRVVTYINPDGTLGKVLQQTDASQLDLGSADHANEEVTRRINTTEFGANRSDDFSVINGSTVDAAFTLDDGTATLVGDNIRRNSGSTGRAVVLNTTNDFLTLTFVGTGLDVFLDSAATFDTCSVIVDGSNIGNLAQTANIQRQTPVVSGLPYGTHTVKFQITTGLGTGPNFLNFILYGPKKPAIPVGTAPLQEYYLMADFVVSTSTDQRGVDFPSTGVLSKNPTREFIYTGTWSTSLSPTENNLGTFSTTAASKVSYTFFGTGFQSTFRTGTGDASDSSVVLDTLDMTAGNFPLATIGFSGPAGTSYTGNTLDIQGTSGQTARLSISDLTLGLHTVEITRNGAGVEPLHIHNIDIITPVHFPNTKRGSLSLGPGVQLNQETAAGGVDLSKAKAWIHMDTTTNTINKSFNMSAVVDVGTGRHKFYFDKPFKDKFYTVAGMVNGNGDAVMVIDPPTQFPSNVELKVFDDASPLDRVTFTAVFFGELENEEGDE